MKISIVGETALFAIIDFTRPLSQTLQPKSSIIHCTSQYWCESRLCTKRRCSGKSVDRERNNMSALKRSMLAGRCGGLFHTIVRRPLSSLTIEERLDAMSKPPYVLPDHKKIVSPPMVYISGEEMTRYTMQLILEQWIEVCHRMS